MRPVLVASLLVCAAGRAQPSPAELEGARFYSAELVRKVRAGRFDPFEYWTAYPTWVAFPKPGRIELQYGQESLRCRFKARGRGNDWALRLRCEGEESDAEWTWLPEGGALTDVIDVPDGELARLDVEYEELVRQHERAYAAKAFAALAGRWVDGKGGALVIDPGGRVTLDGHSAPAQLEECLHVQVEPMSRVPCLSFQDRAGKEISFALLDGFAWVEGRIPKELVPDGRPFEGWQGGRVFRRPPTQSQQASTHTVEQE